MRLLAIYLFTVAISACLLFAVQPLVGRLVLPLYGGSPAVWNTCMMFFQAMLLLGYLYAHLSDRWFSTRTQMFLHIGVVLVAGCFLPIAVPDGWAIADAEQPVGSLLWLLALAVGGPFFALSANATLLQRWFSSTTHSSAGNPYFLYAVSNAGSMVGLLAYPFLVEPNFGLAQQTTFWAIGYGGLLLGIVACLAITIRNSDPLAEQQKVDSGVGGVSTVTHDAGTSITWSRRAMWVLLSALPSSWLLSVTTRLTTDIAPIPLLWVVPLAIYLLSFVLVFASRAWFPHRWSKQWMAAIAIVLVAATAAPHWTYLAGLHLGAFFLGAMLCHGELVRRRPNPAGLTEFYLWLSVGGVLGGFFNAIVAPHLFTVLLEFGVAVAIVCLFTAMDGATKQKSAADAKTLAPKPSSKKPRRRREVSEESVESSGKRRSILSLDFVHQHWPLLVAMLISVLLLRTVSSENASRSVWVTLAIVLLIPTLVALVVTRRTVAFAALVGAALMIAEYDVGPQYDVVYRARSFFGRHLVVNDNAAVAARQQARYRRLLHGTTQHGFQSLDESRACEPLAYYHRSGPLGDVFSLLKQPPSAREKGPLQVSAIGLGTGAVACYAGPDCEITFIEVDPVVRDIATEDGYFTYLSQCGADHCRVVMADGRQAMAAAESEQFDLVLLDAFSSDAVPTHLMTREAIAMYMQKLGDEGMLVFHISNKYLRLDRVLAAAAEELQLAARVRHDRFISEQDREASIAMGKADAWYFVLAKDAKTLARLPAGWEVPTLDENVRTWTDDYSNILSVMQFR